MEFDNRNTPTLSLSEYGSILIRRRRVILWSAAVVLVAGVLFAIFTKPVYEASARILIDNPMASTSTVDASNPLSSLFVISQPQSVDTQATLLQAVPLLAEVTREVGFAKVDVEQVESTNVLEVTTQASDPQIAAAFANRLLELYIEQSNNQSLDEINAAVDFMTKQEATARLQLSQSAIAIEHFKQAHQLTDLTSDRGAQLEDVVSLGASLQKDESDLAGLNSQISQAQREQASEPEATSVKVTSTNPQIDILKNQISQLQVQRASMTQPGGYTDKAPQVMAIDAQIATLKQRLERLPALVTVQAGSPNLVYSQIHAKIVDLQTQAASDSSQITVLNQQLNSAEQKLGHFSAWEVTLAQLMRQHDDAVTADTMLRNKLADLSLRAKAVQPTAHIVQSASLPTEPVRPKRALTILFSLLIGPFLGICLALLLEAVDDRFHNADGAEHLVGLPTLGHVPMISADKPRSLPQMADDDVALECYRVLRTNLQFAELDTPIRTLLVTSSTPGEGKTSVAANLAYAMVMDGKRALLVDTDLRQPSAHRHFGTDSMLGLTDVLLNRAKLDEVLLENTDVAGLHFLPSGPVPANPGELLNSQAFRRLREQLVEEADIVIFDSPPLLSAADAQILASQVDGTILVVEMGEARKTAVQRSITLLRQAHAKILGVAYNKMMNFHSSSYTYPRRYYKPRTSTLENRLKALTKEGETV